MELAPPQSSEHSKNFVITSTFHKGVTKYAKCEYRIRFVLKHHSAALTVRTVGYVILNHQNTGVNSNVNHSSSTSCTPMH